MIFHVIPLTRLLVYWFIRNWGVYDVGYVESLLVRCRCYKYVDRMLTAGTNPGICLTRLDCPDRNLQKMRWELHVLTG